MNKIDNYLNIIKEKTTKINGINYITKRIAIVLLEDIASRKCANCIFYEETGKEHHNFCKSDIGVQHRAISGLSRTFCCNMWESL